MFDKEYAHITTYVKDEENWQNRTLRNEWNMSDISARNTLLTAHNRSKSLSQQNPLSYSEDDDAIQRLNFIH
jgi:hypothetical protein